MALAGEIGWIGKDCPYHSGTKLQTRILRSNAGYFIGTQCKQCLLEDPSPNSRESHYYESREKIIQAFESGLIQWRDTRFRPGPLEVFYLLEAVREL